MSLLVKFKKRGYSTVIYKMLSDDAAEKQMDEAHNLGWESRIIGVKK